MAVVALPMLDTHRVEAAVELLHAAGESLTAAHLAGDVRARAAATRLAVLRAATAVLAVRPAAGPVPEVRAGALRGSSVAPQEPPRRTLDVWSALPRVAPELTEWAQFFAAVLPDEGDRGWWPSVREADDLLRQGEEFATVVAGQLGLPPVPVTGALTSLGPASGGTRR